MTNRRCFTRSLLLALPALALSGTLIAHRAHAAADPVVAIMDPTQAGPDFAVQGEYSGTFGQEKWGAQVVALGNGTFQAVFLPGGLPGDGWDGKTRFRWEGKSEADYTLFNTREPGWVASLSRGEITGHDPGGKAFRLTKVQRQTPTAGLKAPEGAVVLFDGSGTDAWQGGQTTPEGYLVAGERTKKSFHDFTLHLEFRTPFKPLARGQSRGNSGVYLQGRYEIQILDSFGLEGAFNECGAIYRQRKPDLNMCFPPLSWQTYDIDFQAARYDDVGNKTRNAVITVRHNGVPVHDHVEITGPTGGAARRPEAGTPAPISLQNHGNPVVFRNIWIVEKA
jgi:hypothetical protein